MSIFSKIFGKLQYVSKYQNWQELGGFKSIFVPFGSEIYQSEIVRACIRPLAEHTAKASPTSSDKRIEKLLTYAPNEFMNGKDFLSKCRNLLEVKNTLFIYIKRDDKGHADGFYPVPYQTFQPVKVNDGARERLFIKFTFKSTSVHQLVLPWEDLAVLRKDYLFSDFGGEDNMAIAGQLDLIATTNQGVANAVKSTANLRGIIKNTKSMLDDEDVKKRKEQFVKDYLNLENEGGIASLDATQEFTPIAMSPTVTSYAQMKEFRENVYRYFGISDEIVMSKASEEEMETFYESRIEPFLLALSLELTRKSFTERELGFGAYITFTASRLQYASNKTKLQFVAMVDRGAMTPNEWRASMGLPAIEGGDMPIRRLDTATVDEEPTKEGETNENK